MAKVTSKYQVTLPKMIAERFDIHPGDDIEWIAAGEIIHVIPAGKQSAEEDPGARLRLFDQATKRLPQRPHGLQTKRPRKRGWKREELYTRGRSR